MNCAKALYHSSDLIGVVYQFVIGLFRLQVPMPRVLECGYLRLGLRARFVLKKYVVIAVGIERRVEIDQVYRLVLDVLPQDVEIVAVVKGVHGKK